MKAAYEVFKSEARDVYPEYAPKTVSTDGWKGTQAAWKTLFSKVVILLCFLHGWLKIRDRAKHLKSCSQRFPGGFGKPITLPIAGVSGNGCGRSDSGRLDSSLLRNPLQLGLVIGLRDRDVAAADEYRIGSVGGEGKAPAPSRAGE